MRKPPKRNCHCVCGDGERASQTLSSLQERSKTWLSLVNKLLLCVERGAQHVCASVFDEPCVVQKPPHPRQPTNRLQCLPRQEAQIKHHFPRGIANTEQPWRRYRRHFFACRQLQLQPRLSVHIPNYHHLKTTARTTCDLKDTDVSHQP